MIADILTIIVLLLMIVSLSYFCFFNGGHTWVITHFLEKGSCPYCGSRSSFKTKLYVSNESYHDSKQDICCSFYCDCRSSSANIFVQLYHDNKRDAYLYDLAIKFKNNKLAWQENYYKQGDLDSKTYHAKTRNDYKQAKLKGLVK